MAQAYPTYVDQHNNDHLPSGLILTTKSIVEMAYTRLLYALTTQQETPVYVYMYSVHAGHVSLDWPH